jgi:uncharacterized membrane protein
VGAGFVFLLAFGIGAVAGLRALTAAAAIAWAAHLGWLSLSGSPLAFMGSVWSIAIFSLLAVIELITDQLPSTPARTTPPPLIARLLSGALCGACLSAAGGAMLALGALLGIIGAIVGTIGGYQARVRLVRSLKIPDFAIAIPEDLIAIGLGFLFVSRM